MSDIVKVTVTVEDSDGHERSITLGPPRPGQPFVDYEWKCEPVVDHAAEAASGGMWRMMKPGPFVEIKVSAYGRVIE